MNTATALGVIPAGALIYGGVFGAMAHSKESFGGQTDTDSFRRSTFVASGVVVVGGVLAAGATKSFWPIAGAAALAAGMTLAVTMAAE